MTKAKAKRQKPKGKTVAQVLLAVIATVTAARAATLRGVVLDAVTGQPVP